MAEVFPSGGLCRLPPAESRPQHRQISKSMCVQAIACVLSVNGGRRTRDGLGLRRAVGGTASTTRRYAAVTEGSRQYLGLLDGRRNRELLRSDQRNRLS